MLLNCHVKSLALHLRIPFSINCNVVLLVTNFLASVLIVNMESLIFFSFGNNSYVS